MWNMAVGANVICEQRTLIHWPWALFPWSWRSTRIRWAAHTAPPPCPSRTSRGRSDPSSPVPPSSLWSGLSPHWSVQQESRVALAPLFCQWWCQNDIHHLRLGTARLCCQNYKQLWTWTIINIPKFAVIILTIFSSLTVTTKLRIWLSSSKVISLNT